MHKGFRVYGLFRVYNEGMGGLDELVKAFIMYVMGGQTLYPKPSLIMRNPNA